MVQATDPRPLRVLVVDDCPDMRESLGLLLALWGHDVSFANGGREAIRSAQRCPPDVVLLDVGMPGMDGYEVARRLRRIPELEAAYVIALSGFGTARDVAKAAAAGMDRHFIKPIDLGDLERTLADVARRVGAGKTTAALLPTAE